MSCSAKVLFQSLTLILTIMVLASPPQSFANAENEARYQAFITKIVDETGRAVSQVQADGDAARFFVFAALLQAEALGESMQFVENHSKDVSLRDFTAPMIKKQLMDLKYFREHQKKRLPTALQPAASRCFSQLMGDVLISLKEDLADSRVTATEEGFVYLLVAHHAAIIDMAKVFLIFEEDYVLRSVVQDILYQHQVQLKTLRKIQAPG